MKSLKSITSVSFILGTVFVLEGCSLDRNIASSVVCDDRLCSMSEKIELDQTDVDFDELATLPAVTGQKMSSSNVNQKSVSAMGLVDGVLSLTPTMTLVGTISPPYVNGTQVQASDVTINGTKVYVAYNTQGEVQAGAIDVIDISSPTAATLASQSLYPTMDIHKVLINSGKLYAAGANSNGAMLQRITLDSAGKLTSTVQSAALQGSGVDGTAYAGVSVAVTSSNVYAVTGTNGGVSVLNPTTLAATSYVAIPDARDISITSSNIYVVTGRTSGSQALIKKYTTGLVASGSDYQILGATANDEGKSTIISGTNLQVVTGGTGGARVMCLSSGAAIGATANPVVALLSDIERASNAAAFGAGYMFVANGEAGVSVYSVNVPIINLLGPCNLSSITYLGRFTLGTDASANNVVYSNGYLVVATGTQGFKIIKVTTSILSGLLQAL